MQSKTLSTGLFVTIILLAGCTQQTGPQYETLNTEITCPPTQEICILGNPGLLNEMSIYSDTDTVFSLVLRNNLEGDEARNVEVKLKNLSPFYVVEGYNYNTDIANTCSISAGVWKPYEIRESIYVPEPQFISDFGLPFASKMLDIMYPNEEVEFLWNLRTPSRQEIANVAYEHSIDYEISYDYKTSILQTIYAISEQEYQRMLSLGDDLTAKKGTITSSIGALNVESIIEEPVRVSGENSQFSLTYKVNNKRNGIPQYPALFAFQYPIGTQFVGAFSGERSLYSYGYIDLRAAFEYYGGDPDDTDRICLPEEFDKYDHIIDEFHEKNPDTKDICISYDELLDYLKRNFKDLSINTTEAPRIVLKFLYPINLVNEMNYLYFPMMTTESIDVSKYYTFRLKAKYRYSISGSDDIIIVPSEKFYTSVDTSQEVKFSGNMGFNFEKNSDTYHLQDETLIMNRAAYSVNSSIYKVFNPNANNFLHLVAFSSSMAPKTFSCTSDSDCTSEKILLANNGFCIQGLCNYNMTYETVSEKDLNSVDASAKTDLIPMVRSNIPLYSSVFSAVLPSTVCTEVGTKHLLLFGKLSSGNFSVYVQYSNASGIIGTSGATQINLVGEIYSTINFNALLQPLVLDCVNGYTNTLIMNSTKDGTTFEFYDLVLYNKNDTGTNIMKDDFLTRSGASSGYFKLTLNNQHSTYSLANDFHINKGERVNHYMKYIMPFGGSEVKYGINSTRSDLAVTNWQYKTAVHTAITPMETASVVFNNSNKDVTDSLIYISTTDANVLNFNKIYHTISVNQSEIVTAPYTYSVKIGYSPRDGHLSKEYESDSYKVFDRKTYYVNHLPYTVSSSTEGRGTEDVHQLDMGISVQEKINNLVEFIDYKSFIELNELTLSSSEEENVFSDSDLIGYQLDDASSAARVIPLEMNLMSYYQNETVYQKRVEIGGNYYTVIILYSDTLSKLILYCIDNEVNANNKVWEYTFNITVLKGHMLTGDSINPFLNASTAALSPINKEVTLIDYAEYSVKELSSSVQDCSVNINSFLQKVNKKPIISINYIVNYGADALSTQSSTGSVIIGDYNSLAETNSAFGTSFTGDFVRGVVNKCQK